MKIASFDIDGVIFMGDYPGVRPGPHDIIITGRSFEEGPETIRMLNDKSIFNVVFFNPLRFEFKTRKTSGVHKANVINTYNSHPDNVSKIVIHYEDDPIQAEIIRDNCDVEVVMLQHNLVEKENVRHK